MKLLIGAIIVAVSHSMVSTMPQPTQQTSFDTWANRLFDSAKQTTTEPSTTSPPIEPASSTSTPPPPPPEKDEKNNVQVEDQGNSDSLEHNNNPGFSAWANKLFSSTDSSATGSAEAASSSSTPATASVTEPAPFPSPTTITPTPNITNASIIVAALLPPKVLPVTNGMDATNAAHALRFQAAALQREPNRNDTIAKEQAAEQKRNDREEQEAAQKNKEMIKEEEAERDEESQQSAFENEIDAALHAAMAEEKKQNALAQDKIKKEDAEAERIQQDEIRQQEIERKEKLFNRTRHLQEQASKFIQQKKMDENRKQMEEKMKETKKLIQHQNTIATFKKQFIHQYVAKEHRLKDAFQIDTIRHSILDDSLGVEGCSEIGRWSKKRQQCLCPNGHGGEF
jgi:hypothetical protein